VDVDVIAFDQAAAGGDPSSLKQALSRYRGALLEGCTEDWVLPERTAREQTYLLALETLAARAAESRAFNDAVSCLRLAVAADPFRESAHRGLMQALAGSGDYAAAAMTYRDLRLRLHRELNAEPDAETSALFHQLRSEARQKAAGGDRTGKSETPGSGREPAPALPPPAPPAREIHAPPSFRGPRPLTGLIGREEELAQIKGCLAVTRLLTLTGPGGVGKTRMAVEAASELAEAFSGGAVFVDLSVISEPEQAPGRVAAALGAREEPGKPLPDTLAELLRDRRLLLVLDNCEHLLEAGASLAAHLLRECADLHILATSRQALGISGETVWPVPPLAVPNLDRLASGSDSSPARLMASAAARLFVERATSLLPHFRLTADNAPAVAQICRRLDGIPLALELAAARVNALSPEQIAARLDDRFRLLTGGSRGSQPRQQTLRAALDWSYSLLPGPERVLLRRLSLFAGSFSLEAAEAVCGGSGFRVQGSAGRSPYSHTPLETTPPLPHSPTSISQDEVLDLLARLIEKSLVVVERGEEEGARVWGVQYRLLETTRAFGRELLAESGEAPLLRQRHAAYFLALAERAFPLFEGPEQSAWVARLETVRPDLAAALEWWGQEAPSPASPAAPETLAEAGPPADPTVLALRLAFAVWKFCHLRGYLTEGRRWLAIGLERTSGRTAVRADAMGAAGLLALEQGDVSTARSLFREGLEIFSELGDPRGIALALNRLGKMAENEGDYPAARRLHEECLASWRKLDSMAGITTALNNLGCVACRQGDYPAARSFHQQCMAINEVLGNRGGIAWSLGNLGDVALAEGDAAGACSLFKRSLAAFSELRQPRGIVASLEGLAEAAGAAEQPEGTRRAASLLGAAAALREAIRFPVPGHAWGECEARLERLRAAAGKEAFEDAWAAGSGRTLEEAVLYALDD
jgi:non-specific serine/threonine protein kinase